MTESKNFEIAIVRHASDNWDNPEVQRLFAQIVQLKIQGYHCEYPEGVLPVDTTDFICDHIVICQRDTPFQLRPVLAFKSTNLESCRRHRISFPGITLAEQAGAKPHAETLRAIVAACERLHQNIAYVGSWTISPDVRKNRDLVLQIKEIMKVIFYFYHSELRIDKIVAGATQRFKTGDFIKFWGFEPLLDSQNAVLEPIRVKHLFDELVQLQYLQKFTDESRNFAVAHSHIWHNRTEYSLLPDSRQASKKAA